MSRLHCFALALTISLPALPQARSEQAPPLGIALAASPGNSQGNDVTDPLLRVLITKGIVTMDEARSLSKGSLAEQRDHLAILLRDKGILSSEEFAALSKPAPGPERALLASAGPPRLPAYAVTAPAPAASVPPQAVAAPKPAAPAPAVIPAVAPLRLLPTEPQKREGLIPDIKLGTGARLKPYGFFKASVIYDSSSPGGNDLPLPGFLGDSGPSTSPEFHVKARAFRVGSQFEWLDPSPKWTITGRFEADFEGNFSRANNRNISSARSSMFSLRTAWGRLDRTIGDKTNLLMLFGQDWTPFGSSTLPNMVETTGLGLGYGILYERLPQYRIGLTRKLSKTVWFTPEFAVTFPAFGNLPANISDQLAFGERQGADSGRPEVQGRFVLQFLLDKAPGVAPAQLIGSWVQGSRTAIVCAAGVPAAFKGAFPDGAEVSSDRWGYSVETQLPTRYFTLLTKYYAGKDLRFYFVGSLFSNFNDLAGLTGVTTGPSIDGASNVAFGLLNGTPTVAPQRGVRTLGGFVNLGFPLSRIFNAKPGGRMAGWSSYALYSFDYAYARDVRRFSGGRAKNDMLVGNLQYKLNSAVTFQWEQSYYRTRTANRTAGSVGGLPLLRGIPSAAWHDLRFEFATLFAF